MREHSIPTGLLILVAACSSGDDDGRNGGPGGGDRSSPIDIYLAEASVDFLPGLSTEGLRTRTGVGVATDCQYHTNDGPGSGLCLTPHTARGWASEIALEGENDAQQTQANGLPEPSRCGPGRLLQLDDADTSAGARGGGAFDLHDPVLIGGDTSLSCDEYETTTWQGFSVQSAYLDLELTVPGQSDYWTVRFIFEPNPLTEDPVFQDATCDLRDSFIEGQRFLSAQARVQRGDILLCRNAELGQLCADEDFEFLDLDSGDFVATRPSRPHGMPFMRGLSTGRNADGSFNEVFCNTDCERDEPYCGYSSGGYDLSFRLPPDRYFRLHSEMVESTDARHPHHVGDAPGASDREGGEVEVSSDLLEPVDLYTYQAGAEDAVQGFGRDLQAIVRFDLSEMVLLDDVADEAALVGQSAAAVFQKISLREMTARGRFDNYGHVSEQPGWADIQFAEE